MTQEASPARERLLSLDVFRGLTIAGMVLVNNPGSWGAIYPPLEHAAWDGWTPTDFIFPFFLFIVGVAITYSFEKRLRAGVAPSLLFVQALRRALLLFLLGMMLQTFPNFRLWTPFLMLYAGVEFLWATEPVFSLRSTDPRVRRQKYLGIGLAAAGALWLLIDRAHFAGPVVKASWEAVFPLTNDAKGGVPRIPGVLQRIALCYLFASLIVLRVGTWGRLAWALALMNIYYLLMRYIPAPEGFVLGAAGKPDAPAGAPFPGALNDYLDVLLLGDHLYKARPDPEGLLSTLPAISSTLFGVLAGQYLQSARPKIEKPVVLLVVGQVLLVLGWGMDLWFPINKKIWTSSYVVFVTGWALTLLAVCYWACDVKGWRSWATPLLVFGTNAILIFFASGILGRLMAMIQWKVVVDGAEKSVSLRTWFWTDVFAPLYPADPRLGSLAYAVCFILFWLVATWPLYRKGIFLKV